MHLPPQLSRVGWVGMHQTRPWVLMEAMVADWSLLVVQLSHPGRLWSTVRDYLQRPLEHLTVWVSNAARARPWASVQKVRLLLDLMWPQAGMHHLRAKDEASVVFRRRQQRMWIA